MPKRSSLRLQPALQTLDELLQTSGDTFDFAYIDADKPAYGDYYERVLRLLRPGGVMAIDNVLWGGEVVKDGTGDPSTDALRALNVKIGRDERVDASLVPCGDGLMIVRKV